MSSSDVIVIGEGPAGTIASALLAEHGLDVLLIEKNPDTRKPCDAGIPSPAFREFGIFLDIIKKYVSLIEIAPPSKERLLIELK